VIALHADAKLYIVASPEVRAERRCKEMEARGLKGDFDTYVAEIVARDARDMGRDNAPLAQASDADLLDTSNLSIDESVRQAIALVDARLKRSTSH
jgi:cytidylate kinase